MYRHACMNMQGVGSRQGGRQAGHVGRQAGRRKQVGWQKGGRQVGRAEVEAGKGQVGRCGEAGRPQ